MDPWAGYRNSRDTLFSALDKKREEERQSVLDQANLRNSQQTFDLNQMKIDTMKTQIGKQKQLDDYIGTLDNQTMDVPNPLLEAGPVQGGAPDYIQSPLSPYQKSQKMADKAMSLGMVDKYKTYQDITAKIGDQEKALHTEIINRAIMSGKPAAKQWLSSIITDPQQLQQAMSEVDNMDLKASGAVELDLPNGQVVVRLRKPDGTIEYKISSGKAADQWSDPYPSTVGGKEVYLQKNLTTGQVRQVAAGATGLSKDLPEEEINQLADALLEGSAPGNLREIFSVRSNNIARTILAVNKKAKEREESGRYTDLALKWEAAKKKTQTLNSPNITRLTAAAESLTEGQKLADGTMAPAILDQLIELRDKIPNYQIAKFNNWANFVNAEINDPDVRAYRALVLSAADKIATINSGGGSVTSDFKDRQAQAIFSMGLNKEALKAVVKVQKKELQTQTASFVNSTPLNINYKGQVNPQAGNDIRQIMSVEDYYKLKPGAIYIDPQGVRRTKGAN